MIICVFDFIESAVMRFDGKQHLTVTPRVTMSTLSESLSVQFRTKHSHGAVVNTRSKDRKSGIDVFMYMGKLYIQITLKATEHVRIIRCSLLVMYVLFQMFLLVDSHQRYWCLSIFILDYQSYIKVSHVVE